MPLNISSNAKGILFIIAAISCLSVMDGVTRYLTDYYNVISINMFRYFFLFLFVISINSIGNKSVILVSKSKFKLIQIIRGTILAVEMCFAHYLFLKIGLIETHAIFASCPLIVAALSVVFLREKVGWRRWAEPFYKAGADICTVLGASGIATIKGVIAAAKKYGKECQVDMINVDDKESLAKEAVAAGDPVMVAKGGTKLIDDKAIKLLKNQLIKIVDLITPNIPEA